MIQASHERGLGQEKLADEQGGKNPSSPGPTALDISTSVIPGPSSKPQST